MVSSFALKPALWALLAAAAAAPPPLDPGSGGRPAAAAAAAAAAAGAGRPEAEGCGSLPAWLGLNTLAEPGRTTKDSSRPPRPDGAPAAPAPAQRAEKQGIFGGGAWGALPAWQEHAPWGGVACFLHCAAASVPPSGLGPQHPDQGLIWGL